MKLSTLLFNSLFEDLGLNNKRPRLSTMAKFFAHSIDETCGCDVLSPTPFIDALTHGVLEMTKQLNRFSIMRVLTVQKVLQYIRGSICEQVGITTPHVHHRRPHIRGGLSILMEQLEKAPSNFYNVLLCLVVFICNARTAVCVIGQIKGSSWLN